MLLAGFFTSGADLLRRTLTGDNEHQATKAHSKNKRSKMALSRSERKVNLALREFFLFVVFLYMVHIYIMNL
jgi:hypothetical protein